MNNPLAKLYSTSTLERHHLNHCLLLLNIKGNDILESLSQKEYSKVLSVIENCILATDLELHFKHRDQMAALFTEFKESRAHTASSESAAKMVFAGGGCEESRKKTLLESAMMTAADLGTVTKPWPVHRHVSQLLAEEFWTQGDIEKRELQLDLPPMLDRRADLSSVQLGFIDNICTGLYKDMVVLDESFLPMLDGCLANRRKWAEMNRKADEGIEELEEDVQ